MLRRALALLVVAMFVAVSASRAEDPEQELRFLQELRNHGQADLALEYMDKLKSRPKIYEALKAILPLERARCRLAKAEGETDAGQRLANYRRAQEEFEAYLKGKPPEAEAAEANLELARVAAAQGRQQFRKGVGDEDDAVRTGDMTRARELLQTADTRYREAIKQIKGLIAQLGEAKSEEDRLRKGRLARALDRASLERGIAALERGLTFDDVVVRGKTIDDEAVALLEKVAEDEANPFRWEAHAWLVRCHGEVDKVKQARKEYVLVMNSATGSDADEARRLGLAHYIRFIANDGDVKDKPAETIKLAEDWLRRYRRFANTPEGNSVRFRLAQAYAERAQATKNPRAPEAMQSYKTARDLFKALELGGSEYANRARNEKIRIILALADTKGGGDVNRLNRFEECYIEAQREMYLMTEEQKKLTVQRKQLAGKPDELEKFKAEEKKVEKGRKAHFRHITAALERALTLPPDPEVSPKEVAEARAVLAYCYLESGDLYRAAVLAEDLAHNEPDTETASGAAAYALQAYLRIVTGDEEAVNRLEQLPEGDDDKKALPLRRLELQADSRRVARLATYMEQKWPDSPVTDFARHQLAFTLLRDKDLPEAMAVLARITPSYNNYAYARYQLALAALELMDRGTRKDGSKLTDAEKKNYENLAITALQNIPGLGDTTDDYSAQVFVLGRLKLGQIYFRNKRFDEVEKLADQLNSILANPRFAATQNELRPGVEALLLSAKYARLRTAYDANNYAKVIQQVTPEIAELEGKVDKQTGKLAELPDRQMVRAILGIALRAYIEQGKTAEAQKALSLLQKTAGEGESITATLLPVAQQFRERILDLEKKGPEAEAQLKKTKESFVKFLDELAKQPEKSLGPEVLIFIAQSFGSLGEHEKAVRELKRLPPPTDDPKPPKGKEKDAEFQKQLHDHQTNEALPRAAYVLLGRELREAKQMPEAEKVLDAIRKMSWGKQNLQAMMEWNYLLMDQGKLTGPNGAIQLWNGLLKAMQPRVLDPKTKEDFKEPYFTCYFQMVKSFVLHGKKLPWEKRGPWMKKAAELTATLQKSSEPWGTEQTRKRFEELLTQEPEYKAEFDKIKAPDKK
jgi:hypothetical protein